MRGFSPFPTSLVLGLLSTASHAQFEAVGTIEVVGDGQVDAPGKVVTQHDQPLLVALARAFYWKQLLDDGVVGSGSEIARREVMAMAGFDA